MSAMPIPRPGDRIIVYRTVWYDPTGMYPESGHPEGLLCERTVEAIAMSVDIIDNEILVSWRSVDGNGFCALDRPARSMECAYGVHILGWAWPDPDVVAANAARLRLIALVLSGTADPPIETVRADIGEQVYNSCKRNGIDTISEARRRSDAQLLAMRGFGQGSLARLRAAAGVATLTVHANTGDAR